MRKVSITKPGDRTCSDWTARNAMSIYGTLLARGYFSKELPPAFFADLFARYATTVAALLKSHEPDIAKLLADAEPYAGVAHTGHTDEF
jgi:hypothetical protein